jgi:hypothetical protein
VIAENNNIIFWRLGGWLPKIIVAYFTRQPMAAEISVFMAKKYEKNSYTRFIIHISP